MGINKKKAFLWSLYDFANSISTVVFFLYFSQWLVVEHGVADFWYNMIFVGSSILLVFTSPIAGVIADKINARMPFLIFSTFGQFTALAVAAFLALAVPASSVTILWAALAFMIGNYLYQFSLTFYNALLTDIAAPQRQGTLSGWGQFANWSGQVVGLLAVAGFASGAWYWFGAHGRAQTLLPAILLMILLALPMLLWFKESSQRYTAEISVIKEYRGFLRGLKELCAIPGVGRYLLAFFLFNDALLTATNNFPIYLQQVFHVSDKTKSLLLVGILVMSALGGLAGGWIADKVGLKKTLLVILASWITVFAAMAAITNFSWFVAAAIMLGILYGATWAVTRAVMASLVPHEKLNHAFSYYALAERFSTFLSPLTWGIIVSGFVYLGPLRYHLAMLVMTGFILLGFAVVRKIPLAR